MKATRGSPSHLVMYEVAKLDRAFLQFSVVEIEAIGRAGRHKKLDAEEKEALEKCRKSAEEKLDEKDKVSKFDPALGRLFALK